MKTTKINILIYPCKEFLPLTKFKIKKGEDVYIKLSNTWNSKLITSKIINLIIDENSEEKSWKFIFCILLNPIFFTTYFYAFSEDYRIIHVDKINKLIN